MYQAGAGTVQTQAGAGSNAHESARLVPANSDLKQAGAVSPNAQSSYSLNLNNTHLWNIYTFVSHFHLSCLYLYIQAFYIFLNNTIC